MGKAYLNNNQMTDAIIMYYSQFTDNRLDYPQYTRPVEFMGLKVPEILLSGNHEKIKKWRELQKTTNTLKKRPELLIKHKKE